jgi:two-component system cell cycle response regulator
MRSAAMMDALTGLPNRRALMDDLQRTLDTVTPDEPWLFALFDLDGFKGYNDSFGHPAGDALLERLGRRLADALPPGARAYRLGGDEFCLLTRATDSTGEAVVAGALSALAESGDGFSVTASGGSVLLPAEADTRTRALLVADQRMYAQKDGRRGSPARQARDLLMRVVEEREPDLHAHVSDVARLCVLVGRRLGMSAEDLDITGRAAELHDVGKMAVPDSILEKPGPLNEREWEFMRRHTIIGERILSAAPAMLPVAKLVRASHERWDGQGYPDGLRGEQIPLGSRVILACDALQAMTSDRPYDRARTLDEAVAELRRCAGTQFDPDVVQALCAVLDEAPTRAAA